MLGAAMPEAAIHENGNASCNESDINGSAGPFYDLRMEPKPKTSFVELAS
jgi:hypothetical protein